MGIAKSAIRRVSLGTGATGCGREYLLKGPAKKR